MSAPDGGDRQEAALVARTRALAEVRALPAPAGLEVLAFEVGGERYGVPVADVALVLEARALCPLVGAPRGFLGAALARARIVPVIDLRAWLGLEGAGLCDLTRILVLERDRDAFGVGVEALHGRIAVPSGALEAPPGPCFSGLAPGRLAILDVGRLAAAGA